MKKKFITTSKEETWDVAKDLLEKDLVGNVIFLKGELGTGKTTFAQGILTALGAQGPFTSPTFVIMKVYRFSSEKFKVKSSKFRNIYHFDCYRVGPEDILEIGWEEIIANPKNLVLVEWPERIKKIWPKKFIQIDIQIHENNTRKLKIFKKLIPEK